ncbi:probable protein ABIL5 [Ananas comosus]|uniref:Probable protein ABIL5 n=1 Tax=Ananas comosus TaxID=4615 RepID=A0A6P5FYX2_ANACO|nr:probable protein ABIL5 [Ananas comosus]
MEEVEKEKEKSNIPSSSGPIAKMPLPKSPSLQHPDAQTGADQRFNNALRELKDLRSQLHTAADYCEDAFLKAERKKIILESTKSYVCDAIVAVIDHLGTVSSKLDDRLCDNTEIVQTEHKIDSLKQRLSICQQNAVAVELSTLQWTAKLPQHHRRYVSQSAQRTERQNSYSRNEDLIPLKNPYKKDDRLKLADNQLASAAVAFAKPRIPRSSSGRKVGMALADRDSSSMLAKSFGLKLEDFHLLGGGHKKKNLLSFLRMRKRKT